MISQIEKLDKLVNELWEKINQEAIEYRKNILIPFCDEYKLAYGQGMGRFFFYDKEWNDSSYVYGVNCGPEFDEFLHLGNSSKLMKNSRFVSRLRKIIVVLNYEIDNIQCFGYCIEDYISYL
jgi:hypothetical protein